MARWSAAPITRCTASSRGMPTWSARVFSTGAFIRSRIIPAPSHRLSRPTGSSASFTGSATPPMFLPHWMNMKGADRGQSIQWRSFERWNSSPLLTEQGFRPGYMFTIGRSTACNESSPGPFCSIVRDAATACPSDSRDRSKRSLGATRRSNYGGATENPPA